jgi:hypothetical protein
MFYKYNRKELKFERNVKSFIITLLVSLLACVFSYIIGINRGAVYPHTPFEKELIVLDTHEIPFSQDELVTMLKDLNVKYPHIVLAQSILETGHYSSTIFKTNHNLFGMKEARQRVKTALGTQLGHAYYDNWKESVYDYAFFQCRYLGRIDNETEYYQALDASYAEAGEYSLKLKQIVERENLKDLF